MHRRTFVGHLAGGLLAAPFAAGAQPLGKVARIGCLRRTTPQPADIAALRQGLQEFGYVEGQSLLIEERYANGDAASLPRLARELQQLKMDVLVVDGVVTTGLATLSLGPKRLQLLGEIVSTGRVGVLNNPTYSSPMGVSKSDQWQKGNAALRLRMVRRSVRALSLSPDQVVRYCGRLSGPFARTDRSRLTWPLTAPADR